MTEEQYEGVRRLICEAYTQGALQAARGAQSDRWPHLAMNHCTRVTGEFLKLFPSDGPEGYALVPIEPTEGMVSAGYDATRYHDGQPLFAEAGFCLGHAHDICRAMIKAAGDRK